MYKPTSETPKQFIAIIAKFRAEAVENLREFRKQSKCTFPWSYGDARFHLGKYYAFKNAIISLR